MALPRVGHLLPKGSDLVKMGLVKESTKSPKGILNEPNTTKRGGSSWG